MTEATGDLQEQDGARSTSEGLGSPFLKLLTSQTSNTVLSSTIWLNYNGGWVIYTCYQLF